MKINLYISLNKNFIFFEKEIISFIILIFNFFIDMEELEEVDIDSGVDVPEIKSKVVNQLKGFKNKLKNHRNEKIEI